MVASLAFVGTALAYLVVSGGIGLTERQEIIDIEQKLTNYSIPFYLKEGLDSIFPIFFSTMLGGAAILPLFQVFTRKNRLNRVLGNLKSEVEQAIDAHDQKNEKIFLESKDFYKSDSENLIENLKSEIDQFKCRLNTEKNETIIKILEGLINTYEKSLSELERIVNFHLLKK